MARQARGPGAAARQTRGPKNGGKCEFFALLLSRSPGVPCFSKFSQIFTFSTHKMRGGGSSDLSLLLGWIEPH